MLLALENSHIWAQAVCNDIYAVHCRVPSNNADDVNDSDSVNFHSLSFWVAKRLKRGREEENNFCSIACIINHFFHAAMKSLFSVKNVMKTRARCEFFSGNDDMSATCFFTSLCSLVGMPFTTTRLSSDDFMTMWRKQRVFSVQCFFNWTAKKCRRFCMLPFIPPQFPCADNFMQLQM